MGRGLTARRRRSKYPPSRKKREKGGASEYPGMGLAIPRHRPQLHGQEVVGGPGSADGYFAVLQLLGGAGVAVLVFLDRLGVDEMGDVDEHALRGNLFAAHLFFQRVEQFVDLDREGAG